MFKVLHIISHEFMMKTHASFVDDLEFTHYYIYQKLPQVPLYSFLPNGYQLIQPSKKEQHFHTIGDFPTSDFKETDKVRSYVHQIKPDMVFISDAGIRGGNIFEWLIENKYPVFFINHGITNEDVIVQIKKTNKIINSPKWGGFTGVFVTLPELKQWQINPKYVLNKTLHPITSITQLDYLHSIDLNYYKNLVYQHINKNTGKIMQNASSDGLPSETKTILWVHNKNNTYSNDQQVNEFKQILGTLIDFIQTNTRPDLRFHLIIKVKLISYVKKSYLPNSKINHPFITIVDSNKDMDLLLYHFLWADAVVIQNYGTSLVEAMTVTPNIVRVQTIVRDNQALMDGFPLLMQAFTTNKLSSDLKTIFFDTNFPSNEYQIDRQKFINQYFGPNGRKNATQTILQTAKRQILGLI